MRRYAHVSSGNYSSFTSTIYTDFALLTCDEAMTSDIAGLFDFMAGDTQVPEPRTIIAAPFALLNSDRLLR